MSTWTSRAGKFLIVLTATAGLSACGGANRFTPSSSKAPVTRTAPAQATLAMPGQDVVVAGPPGFCVDEAASQMDTDPAFVVLGNCAGISSNARAVQPGVKALLTASVSDGARGGGAISDTLIGLDQFFRSEDGRLALSRSGEAGTVEVLDTFHLDGTYYLRARDTSEGNLPGATDEYWRAYFDVGSQIASISVIGFEASPLNPETGLSTLRDFERAMRAANGLPVSTAAATVAGYDEPAETTTTTAQAAQNTSPYETSEEEYYTTHAPHSAKPRVDPIRALYTIGLLRRLFI